MQTYDNYDRIVSSQYYDADMQPAIGPEGCFSVEREYTSRGQISLIHYQSVDGQPAVVDGAYGVCMSYNSYGNMEYKTWLDQNGDPMVNDEGYAAVRYDYDLSNAETAEHYYEYYLNAELEPVQASNGAWGKTTVYYPVTRVHTITYIDQNGDATDTTDGYASYEYEEDENGNHTW